MKISFENPDKVNGLLTLTLEEGDYQPNVEKTLKEYRKKANVPGFRPGMVPMGMIKKQFGTSVKVDEINKLIGEKIYGYIRENNIQMLGEPMPNEEKQKTLDFEKDKDFEFVYDIAVAPEFSVSMDAKDKVEYPKIKIDDKLIDNQVDVYTSRAGKYEEADSYQDNDMLKGDIKELTAKGNVKKTGISVEDAVLMPKYMKDEDQKKLFDGCKVGDVVTFNPRKAYPDSDVEISSLLKIEKDQVKDVKDDFSYQVKEITRFKPAEVNQELFDQVFGEGVVKDEKTFRAKIAEALEKSFAIESDFRFLNNVRQAAEKKVGDLTFPDALLKKIMLHNNKDKDQKFVDDNYDASIKELKWHLIKEQLVKQCDIKIENADVLAAAKEMARAQFAQYGMSNVPEEYIDNYANSLVKDEKMVDTLLNRAVDVKLIAAMKNVVKMTEKEMSLDDYNKEANA